jgi:hypothetical protein
VAATAADTVGGGEGGEEGDTDGAGTCADGVTGVAGTETDA